MVRKASETYPNKFLIDLHKDATPLIPGLEAWFLRSLILCLSKSPCIVPEEGKIKQTYKILNGHSILTHFSHPINIHQNVHLQSNLNQKVLI